MHTWICEHFLQLSLADVLVIADLVQIRCDSDVSSEEKDIVHCCRILFELRQTSMVQER